MDPLATPRSFAGLLDVPSFCASDFRFPTKEGNCADGGASAGGELRPSGRLTLVVCVGIVGAVDAGGITVVDEDDDGIESLF